MKTQVIDGRALAEEVKDAIAAEVFALVQKNKKHPSLAIVLVGDRPDSRLYVSLKEREAKKIGFDTHLYQLPEESSEDDLLTILDFLNKDSDIDAVLVQLPLPEHLPTEKIMAALDPQKDADGFLPDHPKNVTSPVVAAVRLMLERSTINHNDLQAGVLYNSPIFGEELKKELLDFGCQDVVLAKKEEADKIWDKDIIVSALGAPHFFSIKNLKKGAIVIDIGINYDQARVRGDFNPEGAVNYLTAYSPVPGGIGPLTIAFLFKNVLSIYQNRQQI